VQRRRYSASTTLARFLAHAQPRLLITAIALLLLGLVANHFMQRAPAPQFAPDLQGAPPRAPATPRPARAGCPRSCPPRRADHRADPARWPVPAPPGRQHLRQPRAAAAAAPRGYYREYTVDTPGARTRGTRRIVTGGDPPEAWYYTDDHYESFRSFTVPAQGAQ
jgi:hypothetical protein